MADQLQLQVCALTSLLSGLTLVQLDCSSGSLPGSPNYIQTTNVYTPLQILSKKIMQQWEMSTCVYMNSYSSQIKKNKFTKYKCANTKHMMINQK